MALKEKILDPSAAVKFFELVPPAQEQEKSGAIETTMAELDKVRHLADAINLPEIHDETRGGAKRAARFVPRVEPRMLGSRIRRQLGLDIVVNRCVVHEADQSEWLRQTYQEFDINNVILVGGESSQVRYPGPTVLDAAARIHAHGHPVCLGGISIPSRLHEADRIRNKQAAGLDFFTTQVLFDATDIVWLIQKLNGLEARVFLSFAPVSQPRDLQFLRWLGADIPEHLDRFLLCGEDAREAGRSKGEAPSPASSSGAFERSLDLAKGILIEVFDGLPPDPPLLGLNVEHINQRNFGPALTMLEQLGKLYSNLVAAHARVHQGRPVWQQFEPT
jgi:5,10-methylenetetrahydrofolate reductase